MVYKARVLGCRLPGLEVKGRLGIQDPGIWAVEIVPRVSGTVVGLKSRGRLDYLGIMEKKMETTIMGCIGLRVKVKNLKTALIRQLLMYLATFCGSML